VHSEYGWAAVPQIQPNHSNTTGSNFRPYRRFLIPLPYGHFRYRITPGASSSTLQEFDADVADIANVRGELAVVSQDIGDTELQRCSDPTENEFRARAAPHPSECS
jgi:hypothetical protein